MDLPAHPESDEAGSRPPTARAVDWTGVIVIAVIGTLLAVLVILHLTGAVGPGAH
jgi:hypothetical protein